MLHPCPRTDQSKISKTIPEFWKLLRVFWDGDRVKKWRDAIFQDSENPDIGAEQCFNLISLSPDAHDMWHRGVFALKPLELSRDHKELTVQFFWQVPGKYDGDSQIDLLTEPTSSKGLDFVAEGYCLTRVEKEGSTPPLHHICSRELFTFTTEDPENLPLPSVELLEMQWFLQRLVGMCGAAGWPSLDDDDDDSVDNNDGWLIPDYTYSDVHNPLKRVREWVGAEEAVRITPETSTATPGLSVIQCY
jgi:hypothetical protein